MCNNRDRYNRERDVRRRMARDGEQPAIEALVRNINNRFTDNIIPIRYDEIWFDRYDPNNVEWVRGCSDYYLDISTNGNRSKYMYVEVKIKNTYFDTTLTGGVRAGQQIANYGCVSFYLDIVPVYENMNKFCEIANIDKNNFVIMFISSDHTSIRLISLAEINNIVEHGWNGVPICTFGAGYGQRSYLIPKDATHTIDDISIETMKSYLSNTLSVPEML